VIREIYHVVGDPLEVDEKLLKSEGKVRVKIMYKDAMKVDGNTLIYINGQGHLLTWCSEKMEEYKKNHPQEFKSSISDKDDEDLEGEGTTRKSPVVPMQWLCQVGKGAGGRRKEEEADGKGCKKLSI
jgi:hypothetical protein